MLSILTVGEPKFIRNLTCTQEPGLTWRCTTQASGTGIKYRWYMNNQLLSRADNRVASLTEFEIVLHNLTPDDQQLTVQAYNLDREGGEHLAIQSAALIVPDISQQICPSTTPSPKAG